MDALCQVWLKLDQRFWRRFKNFVYVFSLFRNYLPLQNAGLYLNKLESPSPKDALRQVCLKLVQEKIFFNFVNVFLLFRNYISLEMGRDQNCCSGQTENVAGDPVLQVDITLYENTMDFFWILNNFEFSSTEKGCNILAFICIKFAKVWYLRGSFKNT